MTQSRESWRSLLPDAVYQAWQCLPPATREAVQEIRLRAGQAVTVGVRGEEWALTADGTLTEQAGGALHCTAAWLRELVDRACEYSVYAHGEELRQGFLPAPAGCRLGVAGTAVHEAGRVTGYRHITSVCLRVAREHRGCAVPLAQWLCAQGITGTLICGEPSSGKTSLLRDLAYQLAARRLSVAVVDERGELSGMAPLRGCDVLCGTPKAVGIEQAVRCLSPRVVVVDELGGETETAAVLAALTCGVPVIASAHGRCLEELLTRPGLQAALIGGAFSCVVQLRGCSAPGEIARMITTKEWLHEADGLAADCDNGWGMRPVCRTSPATAVALSAGIGTLGGIAGRTDAQHRGTTVHTAGATDGVR